MFVYHYAVFISQLAFRLFFLVPDFFVQSDQSTAAVSVADISCNGGGTDVDLVLRVYLGRGTTWSPNVVKGFVAVFQRGKSREIKNKKNKFYCVVSPQTQQPPQYSKGRIGPRDSLRIPALRGGIIHLSCSPTRHFSGPFSQVHTEILSLSQTDRPGILS